MKKLNRKGFTLIELMVVIAILVVIMGIALPNITSSIERSKQKQLENKKKLAVSAGELYFDRHKGTTNPIDKAKGVKINTLVNEGFITSEEVKDLCEDNQCGCCIYYSISGSDNGYVFGDGQECCDAR